MISIILWHKITILLLIFGNSQAESLTQNFNHVMMHYQGLKYKPVKHTFKNMNDSG